MNIAENRKCPISDSEKIDLVFSQKFNVPEDYFFPSKYKLVQSKNELIKATLDYMLIDLRLKKYSSELGVKNIESINKLLVW